MLSGVYVNDVDVGTFGFAVADVDGWTDSAEESRATVVIAGRPGVLATGPLVTAAREIVLHGLVRGASVAAARAQLRALRAALTAAPEIRLRCIDENDVELRCAFVSLKAPTVVARFASADLLVDVTLLARMPYKEALAPTTLVLQSVYAIAPLGDAPVWPVLTLTNGGNPIFTTAEHSQRGNITQTLELQGIYAPVVIDNAAGTITDLATGDSRLANLTDASDFPVQLVEPWAGEFQLAQGNGSMTYRRAYR